MENKYHRFFESFRDFLLKTGFSGYKSLEGCSESTIRKLERKYDIVFPLALRSYLSFFGEKFDMFLSQGGINFTVNCIEHANINAKEIALSDEMKEYRIVTNDVDMSNVLFTYYDESRDQMELIECSEENPILKSVWFNFDHSLDKENPRANLISYNSGSTSFMGKIMIQIYDMIHRRLEERSFYTARSILLEYDRIKIKNVEWIKYHQKYRDKKIKETNRYIHAEMEISARIDFCRLADVKAQETGIVMTIDEFEWAFIEYLRGLGVDI